MRPRSSFAGAAIEVSDLARSVAFHRLWLPMLGFHRVWASPDRVMWSRGYDHFVMRQAKDGISYGPGALWLAVSADSRAQVDQVFAELRDSGAEIIQRPQELDYLAPGYYSVGFRDPDGVPIEVMHRWDELPDIADAEQVRVPGHGISLGGYYGPRAVACEKRIKATIAVCGPYDWGGLWDKLPELTRNAFIVRSHSMTSAEAKPKADKLCLKGIIILRYWVHFVLLLMLRLKQPPAQRCLCRIHLKTLDCQIFL